MKLILDSHILLAISLGRLSRLSPVIADVIVQPDVLAFASVASLWEIGIKFRLGKLDPGMPVESLPAFYDALGIIVLPITAMHAVTPLDILPPARDPFDRILLVQCQVEGCRLVTIDNALRDHPLAARLDKHPIFPTEESPRIRP